MSMLNTILYEVKVFLRIHRIKDTEDSCNLRELIPFWDFQLFNCEAFDRRSKLVDAYYAVWRFFHYGYGDPRNIYRDIKWFIQRGRRGWADCDVWSLDDYLNGWLPAALRRLKEKKHGVPNSVVEPEDCDEHGGVSEAGMERAVARWDAIMDKMIAGFEADKRMQDGLYEEELGQYPLTRPSGVSADAWLKVKDNHMAAERVLTERDKAIAEEGLALFIKHYHSLWD
jgi:hypothetical protein